ncbi:MAG: hypothetical protein ACRD2A_10095 [Vicinamibacterales bacterium]
MVRSSHCLVARCGAGFFASIRDGSFEIYGMNVNGTSQFRVTNHPKSDAAPNW